MDANQKEQKQLQKYQALQKRGSYKGYIIVLIIIIAIIHLLDSFATDITGALQTPIVNEFFVMGRGMSFQDGLALMSSYGMLFMIIAILAPFFKALADKWGRKPIFIISIVGMAVGMLICYIAQNVFMYLLGRAVLSFFVAADLQVVYILEVAPPKKRGTLFSVTKFIGILGLMLIPLLRGIYLTDESSNWRPIMLFPALMGLGLAVFVFIALRESGVFLDNRIKHLQTPIEERAIEKKKKEKSGVGQAFKYCMKHKQTKSILFAIFCFYFAMTSFSQYYESIMSTSGMDTSSVTMALVAYPLAYAILTLFSGIIGDKIGRKKMDVLYSAIALVAFIGFNITAKMAVSPYIVGALFGLAIGAYWNAGDFLSVMLAESTPTELRSSVMALYGLICVIVGVLSGIVVIVAMLIFDLGIACTVIGGISMAIAMIVLITKVKETSGVDLTSIKLD